MSYTIISECTGCSACVKICPVTAISGDRKNLHVIDAKVCIECGACGRICPFRAILDAEGNLCLMLKRPEWLKPVILAKGCVSCGVCLDVCPTGVLDFTEQVNGTGHVIAYLRDGKNCIGCAFCEAACPVKAIVMG